MSSLQTPGPPAAPAPDPSSDVDLSDMAEWPPRSPGPDWDDEPSEAPVGPDACACFSKVLMW